MQRLINSLLTIVVSIIATGMTALIGWTGLIIRLTYRLDKVKKRVERSKESLFSLKKRESVCGLSDL